MSNIDRERIMYNYCHVTSKGVNKDDDQAKVLPYQGYHRSMVIIV